MKTVFRLIVVLLFFVPAYSQDRAKEFVILDNAKISKDSVFVIHEKKGDLNLSNLLFNAFINANFTAVLLSEKEQRITTDKDFDIKYSFTTAFTTIGFHKVFKYLDIRIFEKDKLIVSYNYTIRKNKAKNIDEIVSEYMDYLKNIIMEIE